MKKTIHDLVGVPLPLSNELFNKDISHLKRIEHLEGYIELRAEIKDVKEAIDILQKSLNLDSKKMCNILGIYTYQLPNIILSYVVVTYAKSFVSSTGRPSLKNQIKDIFQNDLGKHESIMSLRNKFFAHQEIEANKHQLFCFQNTPSENKVKMNPDGQRNTINISGSIDLTDIEFCVGKTLEYLNSTIDKKCKDIEGSFNNEQLCFINNISKEKLFHDYWKENPQLRLNPFESRKKK